MSIKKPIVRLTLYIRLFYSVWKKDGVSGIWDHLYFFVTTQGKRCFKIQKFMNGKIVFISECPGSSMRYRCNHVVEQLEKVGIKSAAYEISQINFNACVKAHEIIILHRVLYTKEREKIIKLAQKKGKTFIFDIDDLIFNLRKLDTIKKLPKVQFNFLRGEFGRLQKILKICDYAIGSTNKMKIELEQFLPQKCFVHENMIANEEFIMLQGYKRVMSKDKKNIILGYASGTRTHDNDFKIIETPLLKILKKHPKVKLKIIGHLNLSSKFIPFKNQILKKSYVHWKKLPIEISQFDINLAPLERTEFNEAKSDLKFFEAATVAVPTIATDMGAFSKNIIDGKTGFLVDTEKAWFNKIEELICHSNQRLIIGNNAYNDVNQKRNSTVGASNFQRILKSIS